MVLVQWSVGWLIFFQCLCGKILTSERSCQWQCNKHNYIKLTYKSEFHNMIGSPLYSWIEAVLNHPQVLPGLVLLSEILEEGLTQEEEQIMSSLRTDLGIARTLEFCVCFVFGWTMQSSNSFLLHYYVHMMNAEQNLSIIFHGNVDVLLWIVLICWILLLVFTSRHSCVLVLYTI